MDLLQLQIGNSALSHESSGGKLPELWEQQRAQPSIPQGLCSDERSQFSPALTWVLPCKGCAGMEQPQTQLRYKRKLREGLEIFLSVVENKHLKIFVFSPATSRETATSVGVCSRLQSEILTPQLSGSEL